MVLVLALLAAQSEGLALLHKGHYLEARTAIEEAAKVRPPGPQALLEVHAPSAAQRRPYGVGPMPLT